MNSKVIHLFFERSDLINWFFWITLGLYFINIILNNFCKDSKSINIINDNKKSDHSLFMSIMILLIIIFLTLIKPFRIIITFFSLFSIVYIFIISPIFDLPLKNIEDNNYIKYKNNTEYYLFLSYIILMNVYVFANNSILYKIFTLSKNEYIIQSITIIALLIISFCMIYILLINLYWFIFHVNTLFLNKFNENLKQFIYDINKKFEIKKYEKKLNKQFKINQITIAIKESIKILLAILINIIIANILSIISIMIDCILKITSNPKNVLYKISKMCIIISMFATYIIIQINNSFYNAIVDIYELGLTAIIVPIILEKLINRKSKQEFSK